ncbi:hypothetical protein RDT67_06790 [Serratia fonticola]|uniref:Antirestriction protein n=1 Tax=Serratia fonticola TaxID=47917 RepID=A0AAJ1YB50_SERFO|nr:hypothetical protein [Serratia fonticola]MDQ9126137.1 hypothetical protein [Serratia fonticola]
MQHVPADARQADWYPLPLDNHPGSRSISDDDICAWCRHLYYRPGERSLCRLVEVKGEGPACFDPDGYAQSCTELQVIFTLPS